MSGAEDIRAQALEVAAGWSGPDAPGSWQLTAGLFRAIAGHPPLLIRLAGLPADTLPALLASAAVSLLVRRDQPQPLAGFFPQAGRPQPPFGGGFEPAAAAFISARLDEIVAVCRRHRYQMNEVARSAQIATGFAASVPAPTRSRMSISVPGPASGCSWIATGTGSGISSRARRGRR